MNRRLLILSIPVVAAFGSLADLAPRSARAQLAPPSVEALRADTLPVDTIVADTIVGDTITPVPLEEVVVNVLRSPMRIGRAPFAISVLGDELTERGRAASSIEEALHGLPGVLVQNRYNDAVGEHISIRGFGARSQFGVRGIRVFVDGIPATLPDGQSTLDHLDLGSLGRVEALRGPGAAMYGNAAGGVLTFESRPPSARPIGQEIRVVSGDHGMRRVQSTTSGSFGDGRHGYSLSLSRYAWEGFRTVPGGAGGRDFYGDTKRDQLNLKVSSAVGSGDLGVVANHLDLASENPGSLSRSDFDIGDRRAFPGNLNQGTRKDVRQSQLGVSWSGDAFGRQLDIATHLVRRELWNPIPSAVVRVDRWTGGVRGTLRTERPGAAGNLWWAAGFESDLQVDVRFNWTNAGGEAGTLTVDQRERVLGGAVFVQALLPINSVLDVMTGLRYDRIHLSARDRMTRAPEDPVGSGSRALDSASPSFGLHAAIHRAFNTYLNLSTAFETPTTTELANRPDEAGGFNPDLNAQVGMTAEVGARGFVGDFAAWEVTFFHTMLHNELVPYEVENAPGRRYFRNSGRSDRQGVEATLQYAPHPAIGTLLVLTTNDARFRVYEVDEVSYAGNRVPGIAPYQLEGILRFSPGRGFAELRGEIVSRIPADDANTSDGRSPTRRLVDLRAGANDLRISHLSLSPFLGVTNLLDATHVSSVAVNAFGGRYFEPGPGRSVYIGAAVTIGH